MNDHAAKAASLLARMDELDDQHVRAALRAALLGIGELRAHHDPAAVVEGTLAGVERAMDAPAITGAGRGRDRADRRAG